MCWQLMLVSQCSLEEFSAANQSHHWLHLLRWLWHFCSQSQTVRLSAWPVRWSSLMWGLRHHCPTSAQLSLGSVCFSLISSIVSFYSFKEAYIFTARCYASAVLAMALCLSVCPSICPSIRLFVTSQYSTKTAKRRITQTTPHDTPGTLVYWCQRSPRNLTGVTPYEGAKRRWGGSKSATFDK